MLYGTPHGGMGTSASAMATCRLSDNQLREESKTKLESQTGLLGM